MQNSVTRGKEVKVSQSSSSTSQKDSIVATEDMQVSTNVDCVETRVVSTTNC